MERLTLVPNDGRNAGLRGFCTEQDAINRLAAYEDTGLEPEEVESMMSMREIPPEIEYAIDKHASSAIEKLDSLLSREDNSDHVKDLLNAESEGRLLVLPCKVGDTVYTIIDGKIYEGEVYHISYSDYYGKVTSAVRAKIDFLTASIGAAFEDFGKTAFLTRRAAEAKLKEG